MSSGARRALLLTCAAATVLLVGAVAVFAVQTQPSQTAIEESSAIVAAAPYLSEERREPRPSVVAPAAPAPAAVEPVVAPVESEVPQSPGDAPGSWGGALFEPMDPALKEALRAQRQAEFDAAHAHLSAVWRREGEIGLAILALLDPLTGDVIPGNEQSVADLRAEHDRLEIERFTAIGDIAAAESALWRLQ